MSLTIQTVASRIYISRSLSSIELAGQISHHIEHLKGASILIYPQWMGFILKLMGLALQWQVNQQIIYLDKTSAKRFFYKMFILSSLEGNLEERIQNLGNYLALPISPLSFATGARFKANSISWLHQMHRIHLELGTQGYNPHVLNNLSTDYLLQSLGS